jgi:hypothetical protein
MAKKKTDEEQADYQPEQEAQPAPVLAGVRQPEKLYRVSQWRGVKEVFQCKQCETFRDTKDAVIEHILLHYPIAEQEDILEKLMKE